MNKITLGRKISELSSSTPIRQTLNKLVMDGDVHILLENVCTLLGKDAMLKAGNYLAEYVSKNIRLATENIEYTADIEYWDPIDMLCETYVTISDGSGQEVAGLERLSELDGIIKELSKQEIGAEYDYQ